MQRKKLKQPLHNLIGVLELYIKEIGMVIPRYLSSIRNLCSGRKRCKSKGTIDSYVFSSNCHSTSNHQKNANESPYHSNNYHSPPSSLNTPFRRSH